MTRITVVTGGGRGIGAAVSRRLAAEGHDIVISFLNDRASAERTAAAVRDNGQRALVVQADSTDADGVKRMIAQAAQFGPLTGLVNNAGSATAIGRLADNSLDDIRRDIDVNLMAVITCCQLAIAPMSTAGGGSIVNISSAAATLGSAGEYVHYAAAKAAVEALTVGLSKELGGDGIRVNAVAPGVIWTEFHKDPERPAKLAAAIPAGRAGTADEVAGAVAWLMSDDASYTTGAVLRVAGGR